MGDFVLAFLISPYEHSSNRMAAVFFPRRPSVLNLLMSLAVDKSSSRGYDATLNTNSILTAIVLGLQIRSIS